MIQIREYLTTKISKSKIKATNDTLGQIVKEEMDKYGHDCDLNHVDVSEVTKMGDLFSCISDTFIYRKGYEDINPDISKWDVSNVKDMTSMFYGRRKFKCDVSEWNVSNVEYFGYLFYECEEFNADISKWDVGNAKKLSWMFHQCKSFNQNLGKWNVENVRFFDNMFNTASSFNQDLSKWNVNNWWSNDYMFYKCPIKEEYKPHFKK